METRTGRARFDRAVSRWRTLGDLGFATAISVLCIATTLGACDRSSPPSALATVTQSARTCDAEFESAMNQSFSMSKDHFVCAGIGHVVDPGAVVDAGFMYYFRDSTRKLISICGMAMACASSTEPAPRADVCPPRGWEANSCSQKHRDFQLSKLPDINEARARAIAHNWAGCHETLRVCEIRGKPENETWVYEIDFVKFADKSAEDWTRMFGLKRVVVGRKGQIVEAAWWGNNGRGPN